VNYYSTIPSSIGSASSGPLRQGRDQGERLGIPVAAQTDGNHSWLYILRRHVIAASRSARAAPSRGRRGCSPFGFTRSPSAPTPPKDEQPRSPSSSGWWFARITRFETATFWEGAQGVRRPATVEIRPKCASFLAADSAETDAGFTNSGAADPVEVGRRSTRPATRDGERSSLASCWPVASFIGRKVGHSRSRS